MTARGAGSDVIGRKLDNTADALFFFDPPCLPKFFTEKWVYIRNKKKLLAADISICYGVDMSVELYAFVTRN